MNPGSKPNETIYTYSEAELQGVLAALEEAARSATRTRSSATRASARWMPTSSRRRRWTAATAPCAGCGIGDAENAGAGVRAAHGQRRRAAQGVHHRQLRRARARPHRRVAGSAIGRWAVTDASVRCRADVLVQVEDVVRVVRVLERGQPGQLRGRVCPPHARPAPSSPSDVDVDAAGERLQRAQRPAGAPRSALVVLGGVGPPRGGDELERRVAVAERRRVVGHVGDRAAVRLQADGRQHAVAGRAATSASMPSSGSARK